SSETGGRGETRDGRGRDRRGAGTPDGAVPSEVRRTPVFRGPLRSNPNDGFPGGARDPYAEAEPAKGPGPTRLPALTTPGLRPETWKERQKGVIPWLSTTSPRRSPSSPVALRGSARQWSRSLPRAAPKWSTPTSTRWAARPPSTRSTPTAAPHPSSRWTLPT